MGDAIIIILSMSQDLLEKLQKDKNFQAEVKKNLERYETLQQASHYSEPTSVPQQILKKVEGSKQIYFYFGYQQPTLKKQMYQVAMYLIKHFKPNVHKPYTFVFFNEKCTDNYVLWNFRETFCCLKIEQIAAIEEFIVVKPYFYHKTMDWMTFGVIPKFIRSKTKFLYSYQQLCTHLKCNINILAQNVPPCLYQDELPNLFTTAITIQNYRINFKGQQRNEQENDLLLEFQKSIKSMIMKPGYQINNLEDYEIGAQGVPNILKMLVFYFDSHREGLELQGLFRKSVSIDEENETIMQILSKNYDYLLEVNNPHIIANLIKRFFSSLKTPVFPFDKFTELMNDQGIKDKTEHLKHVYNSLPQLNKRVLIFIFTFFKEKVIKYEVHNKMSTQNVSICFAPCILRSEKPSTADLIYASKGVLYCKLLLTEFETIFGSKQQREGFYRKSYMESKKTFEQSLDIGVQAAMDVAQQNISKVKNSSRISHKYSDKQVSDVIKIQLQQQQQKRFEEKQQASQLKQQAVSELKEEEEQDEQNATVANETRFNQLVQQANQVQINQVNQRFSTEVDPISQNPVQIQQIEVQGNVGEVQSEDQNNQDSN